MPPHRHRQLAATPQELRGCWSPQHIPHSHGLHGSFIPPYSRIPGDVQPVFKRFEARRASVGQVSPDKRGGAPQGGAAGSLHQAWGGTAGRSCWFHAGARKAFLQKALECLVLADPEGCELTWRKVHMCIQDLLLRQGLCAWIPEGDPWQWCHALCRALA